MGEAFVVLNSARRPQGTTVGALQDVDCNTDWQADDIGRHGLSLFFAAQSLPIAEQFHQGKFTMRERRSAIIRPDEYAAMGLPAFEKRWACVGPRSCVNVRCGEVPSMSASDEPQPFSVLYAKAKISSRSPLA